MGGGHRERVNYKSISNPRLLYLVEPLREDTGKKCLCLKDQNGC
jgi:hypothetical protein